MKKQLRSIIIALCVVVVLVGGILCAKFLVKPSQTTSSSEPTSSESTISVFKTDAKNITALHFKNEKAEVTIHQKDGKVSVDGLADKLVNTDTASGAITTASDIEAEKVIEENATDLKQYGLDNPKNYVDIVTAGKTVTLLIGNSTPTADGTYVLIKGESKVYKVLTSYTSAFTGDKVDFVNLSICGFDTGNASKLTELSLGGKARTAPIVMDIDPASIASASSADSGTAPTYTYLMKSPSDYPLDSQKTATIVTAIQALSADGVISLDMSDANLEKYGLKNPDYKVGATYDGNKMVLDIGKAYTEGGANYLPVVLEGTPVIYKVSADTLSFYKWGLADVCSALLVLPNIDTVKSVTVSSGSESYTISLTGTEKDLKGSFGAKQLDTDNIRTFYSSVIGMTFESTAKKPANGTAYAKVVIEYRDTTKAPTTMEYINLDTRRCFWQIDGKGDFYVLKSKVDYMLSQTRDLVAGKTLSDET